jgi:Dual specificity phosphatase, catalytic domain
MITRLSILCFSLLTLTGCAAVKGTVATYTGRSPVVEVAAGIYICNRYQVDERLIDLGSRVAVINLEYRFEDPAIPGLVMYAVPMHEENTPETEAQMLKAVRLISALREDGYAVVVHCWFGENRSPWVVAHYLAVKNGTDWRTEFEYIRQVRPECYTKSWMF